MSKRVKDLSCNVEGVSDDDYIVGVGDGDCLANAASDSEKLSLSCSYINGPI